MRILGSVVEFEDLELEDGVVEKGRGRKDGGMGTAMLRLWLARYMSFAASEARAGWVSSGGRDTVQGNKGSVGEKGVSHWYANSVRIQGTDS